MILCDCCKESPAVTMRQDDRRPLCADCMKLDTLGRILFQITELSNPAKK
jgi:hypothetical protein